MMSIGFDMKQIENETKVTGAKHVANMLQRTDQLEKVDKYVIRESRKKASVDGVLKTAMQTQLDGVRSGLLQVEVALKESQEINKDLEEISPQFLKFIPEKAKKIRLLKQEAQEHSQISAALENLEQMLNIPKNVQEALEYVNNGKLLVAHQSLAILEASRDDLLYEIHKQPGQSPTDQNLLKHCFSAVEKLSEEISKQLWLILGRTLNSVRKEPKLIVSALRIIEREEIEDAAAKALHERTGFMPVSRPKGWRVKAFQVLQQSVLERIEGNQLEDRSQNKMWLVRHLEVTRKIIVEDLRVVKNACVPCFPEKLQIFDEFVKMYHDCLSKHLQEVIANGLEDNEYITLLAWRNSYGSEEVLGHPDLNIDVSKLSALLSDNDVATLASQYLSNVRKNYQDWIKNTLATDVKDWHRFEGPDEDENGIYHTQLPLIMCNMIDEHLQLAQTVSMDLVLRVMLLSFEEVFEFIHQYEESIVTYKNKHFENRSIVKYFTHYMISIANNCVQFCELADKLRQKYFAERDLHKMSDNLEQDFSKTLEAFLKLDMDVLKYLRKEIFMDLSSHLHQVMTRMWVACGTDIVDTIIATLEDYVGDYVHLYPENFSILVADILNQVAMHYIYSVLHTSRRVSLKTYEERKEAAEKMCAEEKAFDALIHQYPFNRMLPSVMYKRRAYYKGSITLRTAAEKHGPVDVSGSPFDPLPMLAEVIKLKDVTMLSLEVSGIIRHYPDVTVDQLVSLILIRGDVSKSAARQLITEILSGIGPQPIKKTIFSDIPAVL